MFYPKIDTLYARDADSFDVLPEKIRLPEFSWIKAWLLTEKIHGENTRVVLSPDGTVHYGSRKTEHAPGGVNTLRYLVDTFPAWKMCEVFEPDENGVWPEVTIFGETYGPGIHKGTGYRKDVSMRIFDIVVGPWWLVRDSMEDIASKFGVKCVPQLGFIAYDNLPKSEHDLADIISESVVALEDSGVSHDPEGIVARTDPVLFMRDGRPLFWKLKFKDFGGN